MQDLVPGQEIFTIEKVSEMTVVVFANSYINTMSFLPYIEERLVATSFTGEIIFDLLLSNGHNFDRILASSAAGGKINRQALKIVDFSSLEKVVTEKIEAFYKFNSAFVQQNLILSDEEKAVLVR